MLSSTSSILETLSPTTRSTLLSRKRSLDAVENTVERAQSPLSPNCSIHETLQYRSLYGKRMFGRKIHVSGKYMLNRFQCHEDQVYYFYYPDYTSCTPFVCDYAHAANDGNLLAVPDEEGRVSIIRTEKSNDISEGQYHVSFYCHPCAILDVKWSRDDTMLLTSSSDFKSRIMDVETEQCLGTFVGHHGTMKSGNWHPTNPNLFVTTSADGSFRLWDTRYRQLGISTDDKYKDDEEFQGIDFGSYPIYGPIKAIPDAHVEPNIKKQQQRRRGLPAPMTVNRTVTCALFYPHEEDKIITSGSIDGSVKLWDCRAGRSPFTIQSTQFQKDGRRKGISDMKIDHSGTRLFSLCVDNSIYMHYLLDLTSPARRYTDSRFRTTQFTAKLSISNDDQFLLAGSSDNNAYIWDIEGDVTQAHSFEGHTDIVTGVAWHKSRNTEFASCSNDFKVRIWKA